MPSFEERVQAVIDQFNGNASVISEDAQGCNIRAWICGRSFIIRVNR